MIKLLVLFVVLQLVNSQDRHCCLPEQFETRLEILTAVAGRGIRPAKLTQLEVDLWVDIKGQQIREDFVLYGANTTVLLFLDSHTSYVISGGKCQKGIVPPYPKNWTCVPNDANVTDKYRLGYNPSINVVDYSWTYKQPHQCVEVTVSFTDSCMPVGGKFYGIKHRNKFVSLMMLEDLTPAITDSHVFDIPDICKHHDASEDLSWEKEELFFGGF